MSMLTVHKTRLLRGTLELLWFIVIHRVIALYRQTVEVHFWNFIAAFEIIEHNQVTMNSFGLFRVRCILHTSWTLLHRFV